MSLWVAALAWNAYPQEAATDVSCRALRDVRRRPRAFRGTAEGGALLLAACAVVSFCGCSREAAGLKREKLGPPELFEARCSQCHGLEQVLEKTDYTAAHWRAVVDNMMTAQEAAEKIGREEAEAIKAFLADPGWRDRLSRTEGGSRDAKQ